MAKGIIYVMTTVVPGLIKIGKTGTKNYEDRMYQLERNGYSNVVGLKRHYAIEVEDYDEKEILLDDIFSKSRLDNTELFALDEDLVVQLLSSFEGRQVYPVSENKEEVFEEVAEKREADLIPDGTYTMKKKIKVWDNKEVFATIKFINGIPYIQPNTIVCPIIANSWTTGLAGFLKDRSLMKVENDILLEEYKTTSPSRAASLITGMPENGWEYIKDASGRPIDAYRRRR